MFFFVQLNNIDTLCEIIIIKRIRINYLKIPFDKRALEKVSMESNHHCHLKKNLFIYYDLRCLSSLNDNNIIIQ